eukprot:165915-Rhodomonas_salina.1
MQITDLEVVLMSEATIDERKMLVEVRGFPRNNVTLGDVYDTIAERAEDALEGSDLPFDAELE